MASVRLTTRLKTLIKNKGSALFTDRIIKKRNALRPDFYDDVAQAFMDTFMTPYMRNRTFPDEFYRECNQLDAQFSTGWVMCRPLNKTYKILAITEFYSEDRLNLPKGYIDSLLHKEYKEYNENIKLLEKERDDFVKELNRVLNNCNTITQFLKVWPQGEHLIADLELDTTTRTRKKKEIEVDQETLNKLNVGLLKQTMLNN